MEYRMTAYTTHGTFYGPVVKMTDQALWNEKNYLFEALKKGMPIRLAEVMIGPEAAAKAVFEWALILPEVD